MFPLASGTLIKSSSLSVTATGTKLDRTSQGTKHEGAAKRPGIGTGILNALVNHRSHHLSLDCNELHSFFICKFKAQCWHQPILVANPAHPPDRAQGDPQCRSALYLINFDRHWPWRTWELSTSQTKMNRNHAPLGPLNFQTQETSNIYIYIFNRHYTFISWTTATSRTRALLFDSDFSTWGSPLEMSSMIRHMDAKGTASTVSKPPKKKPNIV